MATATRTRSRTCNTALPDGSRCKRLVGQNGCGVNHTAGTQPKAAKVAPPTALVDHDPFTTQPSATPSPRPQVTTKPTTQTPKPATSSAREWRTEASKWHRQAEQMHAAAAQGQPVEGRWSAAVQAQVCEARAEICEHGGVSQFLGLYHDGNRVNARLILTSFGDRWAVFDPDDVDQAQVPVAWVEVGDKATEAGYCEKPEWVPAWARIVADRDDNGEIDPDQARIDIYRRDGGRAHANDHLAPRVTSAPVSG